MLQTKKTKFILAASALLIGHAPFSWSEDQATKKTDFEFGVGVPYFKFDSGYEVEEETGVRGVVGLRTGRVQLELNYDKVSAPFETLGSQAAFGSELDLEQLYGNVLLFGKSKGNFDPFISAGWGQANFEADNLDEETTIATVGAGFKYYIGNNFSIRPAVNYFVPTELEEDYASASVTFSLLTGTPSSTPKKQAATSAPSDSDNDGIVDTLDQCAATPAGVLVDANGCPQDSDGDGVANYLDKCTATESNLKVDDKGCPIASQETVTIDLQVNFDSNSDVVKPQYYSEISRVAEFMSQHKNTNVVIEGHTDTQGPAEYNRALSQKRAEAVAKVLVSEMKVAASRVTAVGYGEEKPLATEKTAADREANRRVVAKISATVENFQTK